MMADPVCSMFIAILIMIRQALGGGHHMEFSRCCVVWTFVLSSCSVYPLMKDSLSILMQRAPHSLDHTLSEGLRKVSISP